MSTDFTDEQNETLQVINVTMSALSMCGSLFIIGNFVFLKRLRSFAFQLIFLMSLCDLLNSIGAVMGSPDGGSSACLLQAYFIAWGELGSLFWTTSIAFTMQQVYLRQNLEVEKYLPTFHLVVWGSTIIFGILPQFTSSYGQSGAWCWIKGEEVADIAFRYVSLYIPLWILIGYMAYVYLRMFLLDRRQRRELDVTENSTSGVMSRIKYYPFILIAVYFFPTLNRIHELTSGNHTFWLTATHTFTRSIKGLLNALLYGGTTTVFSENRRWIVELAHRLGFCLETPARLLDVPTDSGRASGSNTNGGADFLAHASDTESDYRMEMPPSTAGTNGVESSKNGHQAPNRLSTDHLASRSISASASRSASANSTSSIQARRQAALADEAAAASEDDLDEISISSAGNDDMDDQNRSDIISH